MTAPGGGRGDFPHIWKLVEYAFFVACATGTAFLSAALLDIHAGFSRDEVVSLIPLFTLAAFLWLRSIRKRGEAA